MCVDGWYSGTVNNFFFVFINFFFLEERACVAVHWPMVLFAVHRMLICYYSYYGEKLCSKDVKEHNTKHNTSRIHVGLIHTTACVWAPHASTKFSTTTKYLHQTHSQVR